MAIGATSRDVIGMVLTSGLGLVSAGVILGLPAALWTKSYAANVLATVASAQAEAPIVRADEPARPCAHRDGRDPWPRLDCVIPACPARHESGSDRRAPN